MSDEAVRSIAEELADAAGLDVVDAAVKGEGSRRIVRVTVDRKGGVDLATCQRLSRQIADRIDAEDAVDGAYTLEVTSPGTDAPLRDRRAFDRVEGRLVCVLRGSGPELRGTVRAAEDDAVVLDVEGSQVRVAYTEITKATQALPW